MVLYCMAVNNMLASGPYACSAALTCCQHATIVAVQQYIGRLDGSTGWVNVCEVCGNQGRSCIVRLGQHTSVGQKDSIPRKTGRKGKRLVGDQPKTEVGQAGGGGTAVQGKALILQAEYKGGKHVRMAGSYSCRYSPTHSWSTSACRGVRCVGPGERRCRAARSGMMPWRARWGDSSCSLKRRHRSTTAKQGQGKGERGR